MRTLVVKKSMCGPSKTGLNITHAMSFYSKILRSWLNSHLKWSVWCAVIGARKMSGNNWKWRRKSKYWTWKESRTQGKNSLKMSAIGEEKQLRLWAHIKLNDTKEGVVCPSQAGPVLLEGGTRGWRDMWLVAAWARLLPNVARGHPGYTHTDRILDPNKLPCST